MTHTLQSRVIYLFCPSPSAQVEGCSVEMVVQLFTLQRGKSMGTGSRLGFSGWDHNTGTMGYLSVCVCVWMTVVELCE